MVNDCCEINVIFYFLQFSVSLCNEAALPSLQSLQKGCVYSNYINMNTLTYLFTDVRRGGRSVVDTPLIMVLT